MSKHKDVFDIEAEYYDLIWGSYDYGKEVAILHKFFKNEGVKRILDVGCGTGNHAILLAPLGYEVVAIDLSRKMIEKAKKKDLSNRVCFIVADVRKMDIKEKFDSVICLGLTFSHFITKREVEKVLKNIRNALRLGGYFIFNCYNFDGIEHVSRNYDLEKFVNKNDLKLILISRFRPKRERVFLLENIWVIKKKKRVNWVERTIPLRFFKLTELKRMLNDSGFEVLSVSNFLGIEELDKKNPYLTFICRRCR
jgi:SAM-dependent methyltransferase